MTKGVFYCCSIPLSNLAEIDWLVDKPIRDWELEAEVGEQVWKVQYNLDHPSMQKFNRLNTCTAYQFFDVVFDDAVEEDFEDECQEVTLFWQ